MQGVTAKIAVRDRFTHDRYESRAVAIVAPKDSPRPLGNFHHSEIVVANDVHGCDVLTPPFGLAFRMNVQGDGDAKHRQTAGRSNGANTGQAGHTFPDSRIEHRPSAAASIG